MRTLVILFTLFFTLFFTAGIFCQSGDTVATSSGLKYIILKKGSGKKSEFGKDAEVNYTGWLLDGTKFDSSRDRNETFEFTLGTGRVIKGWHEGVALMRVGDEFRLIIPPDLAYGDKGAGKVIPPDATLIFDIELVGVHKTKKSFVDSLLTIAVEKNVEKAIDIYYDLKNDHENEYNFKESQLNILGYQLLQAGKNKEAIEIFKLNVEQFPKGFNTYDSLGEAYMINGDKKLAIKNYEKSLKLNPDNDNAVQMLEKLNEK
jgi:hypothetical protein